MWHFASRSSRTGDIVFKKADANPIAAYPLLGVGSWPYGKTMAPR